MSAAVDPNGNLFLVDIWANVIKKVTPEGVVTTVAGSGGIGYADGTGTAASFVYPYAICYDPVGDCFYISDSQGRTIRKMTRSYVVTTIAGVGGSTGTADGTGSAARFRWTSGIDTDSHGNIYTVDSQAQTIRKITPAGVVTTVAGLADNSGSTNGTGNAARFSQPFGLTVAPDDTIYVCEIGNDDVRKITPEGVVTTLAGLAGSPGFADGIGSAARFFEPYGVASDHQGNVFVADHNNYRVRKITPGGVVTTVAGTGNTGSADGLGNVATFSGVSGLEFLADGSAYVLDKDRVRLMTGAAESLPDTHTWTGLALDGLWSTPANWDENAAPSNGDSVVFPAGVPGATRLNNDIAGLTLKSVTFSTTGYEIDGQSVTLTGSINCSAGTSTLWNLPTTLGGDVAVSMPSGYLRLSGDISLGSGAAAHALTVATGGQVSIEGGISGGVAGATSLRKQGAGRIDLNGSNSWTGGLSVEGGFAFVYDAQGLPGGANVPVALASGGAISSQVPADTEATWDNVFSGAGTIYVSFGKIGLAGASPDFTGAVSVSDEARLTGTLPGAWEVYGTVRGTGTAGALTMDNDWARIDPGMADYAVGRLTTSTSTLKSGKYVVDVRDATTVAGSGWDNLLATGAGGVSVTATSTAPVAIDLRSSTGGAAGDVVHFDATEPYRWPIVSASGGTVSGFSPDKFRLDTTGFTNALKGGEFSLELSPDGTSIDVVFTPDEPPVAGFSNGLACGSGYLVAPNGPSVAFSGAGSYSVEMWVRPHAGATNNVTLMRQRAGGAGTEETWLALTKDRQLFAGIQSYAQVGWTFFGFDHAIPLDQWSHVALVKTPTTLYLYINGEPVNEQAYGWPQNGGAASGAPLTFGGDTLEGNPLVGDLDEIQVYDRALTSAELADTYNRGLGQALPAGGSAPVRYYRLDEAEGTAAADAGFDGVDATLSGMGATPWIESRAARQFTTDGAATPVALAYGDAKSAALTVSVVDQPAHGVVELTDPSRGRGTYTPADGWSGSETFTYQVWDGQQTSAPQTAWVTDTGPDEHVWDGGGGADTNWSTAANWVEDRLPEDGDGLVFPAGSGAAAVNDSFLSEVGDVTVGQSMAVNGSAVGLAGDLTLGRSAAWSIAQTTLEDDVSVALTATGEPAPQATLGGDFELRSPTTGAHTLTVNDPSGSILHEGSLKGSDPACGLVKSGSGALVLGAGSWAGGNTWAGPTDVQDGDLVIAGPGALSSHTDVQLAGTAGVVADFADPATTDVWSNTFTGSGRVGVRSAALTMTAASSAFSGRVTVPDGSSLTQTGSYPADTLVAGLLRGTGTVGYVETGAGGALSPGVDDFEEETLSGGGMAKIAGGASYVCDVGDADEVAGVGYDLLHVSGDLVFSETEDAPVTVVLRSGSGGAAGPATGFNKANPYRWQIAASGTEIRGFNSDAVILDTEEFVAQNTIAGAFALEVTAHGETYQTLDVVYTPGPDTHVWDGGGANDKWSTAANWVGDVAPRNGDTVRFEGTTRQLTTNDLLAGVGGIQFANGGWVITGDAMTTTGDVTSEAGDGNIWVQPAVTLKADAAFSAASGGQLTVLQAHLHDGAVGHGLTLGGAGSVFVTGVDGAGSDCTLTKAGSGVAGITGPNTFGGRVTVAEGTLRVLGASALPAGAPVDVAADATLLCSSADGGASYTWDNAISGPVGAHVRVAGDALRLTGDSSGFAGRTDVTSSSRLRVSGSLGGTTAPVNGALVVGRGSLAALELDQSGEVSPGDAEYDVGLLQATGDVVLSESTYTVDVSDASGEPGVGYDTLTVSGATGITMSGAADAETIVKLRSSDGTGAADAANFDTSQHYRWRVATATAGAVVGFDQSKVKLDVSAFSNALDDGAFSLELSPDGTSLDVVFTPKAPNTHIWSGLSLLSNKWSDPWNWLGLSVPSNGDSLSFVGLLRRTNVNDCLTTVANVHLWNDGFGISGDPLTLTGKLRSDAGFSSSEWGIETTLGAAATVQIDCGFLSVSGPMHLAGGGAGHGLTITGAGDTEFSGGMDGAGADCTLTKQGAGVLTLRGTNTFGGAVTLSAGTTWVRGTQALPADVPVSIAAEAGLVASGLGKGGGGAGTWNNAFSGAGTLTVYLDHLRLTGASPDFTGQTIVDGGVLVADGTTGSSVSLASGGTVGGDGEVAALAASNGGGVWPGVVDLTPASLSAESLTLASNGAASFCVADAAGTAGVGYDTLVAGTATLSATAAEPFVLNLMSVTGGAEGPCAGWDVDKSRRWHLVQAASGLGDVNPNQFSLDTTQFAALNNLRGGTFALQRGSNGTATTIDAVYTPCADFTTSPIVAQGQREFAKQSTQTVRWRMNSAPPAGSVFKLVADDNRSTYGVPIATVPATSATDYTYDWTIDQGPSTGWYVRVELWSDGGQWPSQYRAAGTQTFDILQSSYAITVTAGEHGEITPGTGPVTTFADQTYAITPAAGFHVSDVKVDGQSVGAVTSYEFKDVRADHSISATFAIDTFAVTPSVVGGASGNGTISPSTPQTVERGATPTFTFTPDAGYHVKTVEVDGEPVEMTAANQYTFPAVTADHTISVEFAIDRFTITPSVVGDAEGHGTISPSTAQTVDYGATPTFTFTPDANYHVKTVEVDGEPVEMTAKNQYTFSSVKADHAISVEFAIDTFTITPSVVGDATGHGTVSPDTPQTVDYGATPTFSFAPDEGYHVKTVKVDGEAVEMTAKNQYTFPAVTADHTISVEFAIDTFVVTVEPGAHGTITPGTGPVDYGATATYTVTADEHYHIVDVLVDGKSVGAAPSVTLTDVRAEHTISATFAIDAFTITPSVVGGASGHGTVSPDTPQTVDYGATPTFTFAPDEGYAVKAVKVDGEPVQMTAANRYTFPAVTADHTISVEFAIDTFTVTPSVVGGASGHGAISPNTPQTVDYGAMPTFTFAPQAGYHVKAVRVDGELVEMTGPNAYTFPSVKADHAISVEFAIDTFMVTVEPGEHGTITPGTGPVDYGATVTYTVKPDEHYHVTDVVVDGASVGAVPSVTLADVRAEHTISATFAIDTFTLTPSVAGGAAGHGTISPATPQTVDYGATRTFTFAPEQGYEVDEVLVDGQPVQMTAANEYTFPAVTADHAIEVSFRILTFPITVVAGANGSVTPGTCDVDYDSTPTFQITPDQGYMVADVLVDGESVGAVTSYQFAPVQAEHELSASFVPSGMPYATVSGATTRWSKRPVTLKFTGHPGEGGIPIAFTEYKVGDGAWTQGASVTVHAQGETTVEYRAVDEAGVVQDPAGSCLVRIDTRRPHVVARPLTARHGGPAKLRYMVVDPRPSSGSALVRLVVVNSAGKTLTRSSTQPVSTNAWHRIRISTARLTPGTYTVALRAMDRAGNYQKGVTRVRLTIR